ncbi:hypothetical protein WG66_008700 [Moniliophthora roreri]|nr:hypothetical protein WG66_008700 [Moniliophthora roreri]
MSTAVAPIRIYNAFLPHQEHHSSKSDDVRFYLIANNDAFSPWSSGPLLPLQPFLCALRSS